jgi:cyanuric acid amidohydrolase
MAVFAQTYATSGPGDVHGLRDILSRLPLGRVQRLALLGKTEGTATINDFSRELAVRAAEEALHQAGGQSLLDRATLIFSTGCEGVLTPHVSVIARIDSDDAAGGPPRLAMGGARSRLLTAGELTTPAHIRAVAASVQAAMEDAGLTREQVAIVFVKAPILKHKDAAATGDPAVIARAGSSGRSRAAAALGVALALGEIDDAGVDGVAIGTDHHVHARRAMTFSGTEVMHNEVIVLGNRPGAGGDLMAHAAPLSDILDTRSLKRLFREAGCGLDADGELTGTEKLRGVYLKAGVAPDGLVRGERTTVFQSEVDPDKHMRAAASGLVGGLVGTTRVFVSGGAEHQAPPGGGLCAVISAASEVGI